MIQNEILTWNLLPFANVQRIPYLAKCFLNNKTGLLLTYVEDVVLLNQRKRVTKLQWRELQRIVLFDIWIGNKDRHAANILLYNHHLIAFDHGRILETIDATAECIKLDIGSKFYNGWPDILNRLKGMRVGEALQVLGFRREDIQRIENISEMDLRKSVPDRNSFDYLRFRQHHFTSFLFY